MGVDEFLGNAKRWASELQELRRIIIECGLTEEFKWRQPCYSDGKNNIVIIGELKESCVIGFFKGALLKDEHNVLIQQTKNSQSARIIRFTSVREVLEMEPLLKSYIKEAVANEKAVLKVDFKSPDELEIPEELRDRLSSDPEVEQAFHSLTPGRQKGYILYFSAPKQSKTRIARIEKYVPRILDGKGMNDW